MIEAEPRGFRAPGTTFMVAGGLIGAVGAYIFQAYGGRQLGTEAFAPVAQLWTVFFIIATVLLVPVEQYITREVAGGRKVIPVRPGAGDDCDCDWGSHRRRVRLLHLGPAVCRELGICDSDRAPHDRLRIAFRGQGRLRRPTPFRQGGLGPDRRDRGAAGGGHRRHPTRRFGGVVGLGDGARRIRGPRDGLVALRPGTHPAPGRAAQLASSVVMSAAPPRRKSCWALPR